MAKMGRPVIDEPRNREVKVRVTENEYKRLEEYCIHNKTTKSNLLRNFILGLIGK